MYPFGASRVGWDALTASSIPPCVHAHKCTRDMFRNRDRTHLRLPSAQRQDPIRSADLNIFPFLSLCPLAPTNLAKFIVLSTPILPPRPQPPLTQLDSTPYWFSLSPFSFPLAFVLEVTHSLARSHLTMSDEAHPWRMRTREGHGLWHARTCNRRRGHRGRRGLARPRVVLLHLCFVFGRGKHSYSAP